MKGITGIRLALAAVLLSASATLASAQGGGAPPAAAGARIGYVNAGVALRAMPGYAQAESLYVRERNAAQQELQSMQAALDSAGAAFQQQQAMLSPSVRTTRQRELDQQAQRLQQRVQELQQTIGSREEELLSPMQERLTAIIDGLRAEGNFAVIFDIGSQAAGLIVSIDRSLDITARVLQRIQQNPGN